MHQTVTVPVAAEAEGVAAIIGDLATYPEWLALVTTAVLEDADGSGAHPAWIVTIRAKVGPFARSKQLRMVRTVDDHTTYRFERRELDGRDHSAWTLDAKVVDDPSARNKSLVSMDLRYSGGLWTAPLGPILGTFIDRAGPDLEAYATKG